jgi:hypothetical protein
MDEADESGRRAADVIDGPGMGFLLGRSLGHRRLGVPFLRQFPRNMRLASHSIAADDPDEPPTCFALVPREVDTVITPAQTT